MKKTILMCMPVYYQADKLRNCLESLSKLETSSDFDMSLVINVNGMDDDQREGFSKSLDDILLANNFRDSFVTDFRKNLGKGSAVNGLVLNYLKHNDRKPDYILSVDSDIVFTDPQTVIKLHGALAGLKEDSHIGAVVADQEGESCHLTEGFSTYTEGDSTFRMYLGNEGAAGGVLLVPYPLWKDVKGYRAFNKYGSDDGHFMADCAARGLNVPVVENAKVYHPPETNMDYAVWKKKSCTGALEEHEKEGFKF